MQDSKRIDQLELILSELVHSNEISEKRLNAFEKLQLIIVPVLAITGGGTLFAILKLLEIF